MHELAIAQGIVDGACEHATGRQVHSVTVSVGALCAVVPDALQFGFEIVAQGTPLDGAELIIETIPARGFCRSCGSDIALPDAIVLCPCGSADVEIRSGRELRIRSMEVSDPCARPADARVTAR